jgi:hypothetical protein
MVSGWSGGMDDDEDYNAARGATIAQAAADGALFAERLAKVGCIRWVFFLGYSLW